MCIFETLTQTVLFLKPFNYTPLKMKKPCRNMLGAGTMLFNK